MILSPSDRNYKAPGPMIWAKTASGPPSTQRRDQRVGYRL